MVKKILFSMLITCSISYMAFGMEKKEMESFVVSEELFMPRITSFFGDIEEINDEFQALRDAALFGHIDKIRMLMEDVPKEQRAAFVTARNRYGATALQWAIIGNHGESVRALLEAIPEEQRVAVVMPEDLGDGTILHYALLGLGLRNTEGIRILINAVPVAQRANFIMINDQFGHTVLDLLMLSCQGTAPEFLVNAIKVLMESIPEEQRIAVVIGKNKSGITPLHSAIIYCHGRYEDDGVINSMRVLLDTIPVKHRAAAVMALDFNGNTVLYEAKKYRLLRVVNLLAEYYPQQLAPVKVEEEKEQPSKKRNHDGEDRDSGVPAPKVREKEQPKESGWGCNVM